MRFIVILPFLLFTQITICQQLTTFAGNGNPGYLDGPAEQSEFNNPEQSAVDQAGNIFIADGGNNVIRKIDTEGQVTTYAGTGVIGDIDGAASEAQFNYPMGIAVDSAGNVYVADWYNYKIRVIRPNGIVETLAGTGQEGSGDGPADQAQFRGSFYIAVDDSGIVYIADAVAFRIRALNQETKIVYTIAGDGFPGYFDGMDPRFDKPKGIALDANGNIFIADQNNHAIRMIDTAGMVTTFAGNGNSGFADGLGTAASFRSPKGIAFDDSGNLYVADRFNYVIRKISPDGMVSTIAGIPGVQGYTDGPLDAGTFGRPIDVTVLGSNSLLVSDWINDVIRKVGIEPTSTTQLVFRPRVKVFPNPTQDFITVEGDLGNDFRVLIFDESGRMILDNANKHSISLKGFSPGNYIVQVFAKEFYDVKKVIIQ